MHSVLHVRRMRRRRQEIEQQRHRGFPMWPFVVLAVLLFGVIATGAGVAAYSYEQYQSYTRDIKNPADILKRDQGPAIIYDRNGNFLFEYEDKDYGLREPTPLDAISPWVIKATISTEDPTFYTNTGVNQKGLLRAACEYVHVCKSSSRLTTGGSSITQQLVKLLFEPPEVQAQRSVERKVKEAAIAVELTKRYSKDQILEWYLNTIYYANRANGIGAAAKIYFGKKPADLDLAEASLLAGIPASPADYDPIAHYTVAKQRQREVLDLMVRHGDITQAEADQAYSEPLDLKEQVTVMNEPHWVNFITQYIKDHCKELIPNCKSSDDALYHMGLRITTTLDSQLTDDATRIVDQDVSVMENAHCDCHNGAAMIIDNNTGQILAMVGSRDFYRQDIHGEVNNVFGVYQPGSALKPAVYLAAFLKGWSPGTIVVDGPHCYPNGNDKPFCPSGPTRNWLGPITVREALGSSINSTAVQAADFVGVQGVLEVAHRMGIDTMPDPSQYGVSIATGGSQVTLYDMTYMYSTIANNGDMRGIKLLDPKPGYRQVDPVAVLRIEDRTGKLIYQFRGPDHYQAEPAPYVYEISNILADDSAKHFTYSPGLFDIGDHRPIAAKTGTQQGETISGVRATWNFGYIPDITVGVWVGNSDGAYVNPNLLSATSSLNIWRDLMKLAVKTYNIPPKNFVVPEGIARGVPIPPGSRIVGCGIKPDIYVIGQPVSGPPLVAGQKECTVTGTPTPSSSATPIIATPTPQPSEGSATPGPTAPPALTPQIPPTLATPAPPQNGPPPPPPPPPSQGEPPAQTGPGQPGQPAPPAAAPTSTGLRCPPGLQLPPGVSRDQICGR
jgi:membrane peptidoglycan carboxypeptidase